MPEKILAPCGVTSATAHCGPIGVWMFFLSMLGALLFGAYHHYVLISPDNIGHLPSGSPESHAAFIASAAVLTLLELASALSGAFCLGTHAAQSRAHD